MKILKIAALSVLLVFMVSICPAAQAPSLLIDAGIPAETRQAVHGINNTLFESIRDNRPNVMINMFVEEGKNDKMLEENIVSAYKDLRSLAKGTTFRLLREYLVDIREKGTRAVTVPGDGNEKFIIGVETGKGPVYISLFTSGGNFKDLMLCFVYIKTRSGYRLYNFHAGVYKLAGKGPMQWYNEAVSMYNRGWDVPAMLWIQVMGSFARPAPFISYEKEKDVILFMEKAGATAAKKYKFPMKASWVRGNPEIYGFDVRFDKTRLIPVVIYVTKFNLNLKESIQEEADAITSKIDNMIPGITKCGGGAVAYKAFLEPPVGQDKSRKYRDLLSKRI